MKKKVFAVFISMLMVISLSACGGDDKGGNPLGGDDTSSAPESTIDSSDDEDVVEPTPEPTPEPLDVAFLTGLEKTADYPEDKRVTAIMIGNDVSARPHYGFMDAKILIEIEANDHISRFMAIFEDYENLQRIGPMRSARDQFLQLLLPMQAFYIHDGPAGEVPTTIMLREYNYLVKDIGIANSYRVSDRPAPYDEFTDGERIAQAIEKKGFDSEPTYSSPVFDFVPYNQEARVPSEGTSDDVGVIIDARFRTMFDYDSSKNVYNMYQFNSKTGGTDKTIDPNHNNEQVYFDNVFVVFAQRNLYPASSLPKFSFYGGGAFYFSQGGWERCLWEKGAPDQPLRFKTIDDDGPLYVNPGRTYIAVVDDKFADEFYEALLAGESWEKAAKGTKTTTEKSLDD